MHASRWILFTPNPGEWRKRTSFASAWSASIRTYGLLLSFIQPPEVQVTIRRLKPLAYEFDVSESMSLNKDGVIAKVQWDFNHKPGKFTSTQGGLHLPARQKDRMAGAHRGVRLPEGRRSHRRLLGTG